MPTTHIPAFAIPGDQPAAGIRTARPEVEHCGGCGRRHARTTLPFVGPFTDPRQALRAAGIGAGHVSVVNIGGEYRYIAAGRCCRDAAEATQRYTGNVWRRETQYAVDATDAQLAAMDAAEADYERRYASAAALGL